MALATRCPACSTVFRISTAQATAKGGTVRCGQCRHVFDALDALVRVEDLDVIEEVQVTPHAMPSNAVSMPADTLLEREAVPPDTAELPADASTREDAIDPTVATLDSALDAPSVGAHPAPGDRPATGEWWLPDPADSAALPASEPPSEASETSRDDAGRVLSGRRTDLPAIGIESQVGPAFLDAPTNRLGRKARWTLGIGSLALTILLFGQLAYLWRDELAVRWPAARPWLTAACAPLRCTVGYPAHLDWITIESATIQTTGASLDVYVLNALLRNRASSDVRYPHLELVLTDLQDRPILRRALRPEDYLPTGSDVASIVSTGFGSNRELPIRVTFELTDLRFAGYRLDKFYP